MKFEGSVTSIVRRAFQGCLSLTQISIPESVASLGPAVFRNCTNLTRIYFLGMLPSADSTSLVTQNDATKAYFFADKVNGLSSTFGGVPAVLLGNYHGIAGWLVENEYSPDLEYGMPINGVPVFVSYALDLKLGFVPNIGPSINSGEVIYEFFGSRSEIDYIVEISKDLVNWTTDGVTLSEPDVEGMRTASLNFEDGRCFVRFRFVSDP